MFLSRLARRRWTRTTVRTLTVRDRKMSNALEAPVPFMEAKGNVGKETVENVDFTGRWTRTGRPE